MRGLQDFSASSERYFGDGWALCGDAAVFIDPIFSSGVLLGLECAAGLAEAILGERSFEDWQRSIEQASKAFESAALALYDRSFLTVLFAEKQDPRVRSEIVSLLAGDVVRSTAPGKMAARLGTLARYVER
jgi:flavin-dependent dehydrogenase